MNHSIPTNDIVRIRLLKRIQKLANLVEDITMLTYYITFPTNPFKVKFGRNISLISN